ncbi:hypothetical protein AB0J71_36910 [Nonomuraea sp. NPDC049637]|uniref:hypothetical protein n=1 Tax=Nonomuraea sp. NPDC049637 TaxID=3154356 RepID=UPI00342E92D5
MTFFARVDWTWEAGGAVLGAPTVAPAVHDLATGHLALRMATNRGAPSTADQITSLGASIGVPRNENGRIDGPSVAQVGATFRLDPDSRFHVERSWNSSELSVTLAVSLEDLTAGTVVTGPEFVIARDSGFNVGENKLLFSNPAPGGSAAVSGDFACAARHDYRAWIDLHARVSGAGFGGSGGSGADLIAGVVAPTLSFLWYFTPLQGAAPSSWTREATAPPARAADRV